MNIFALDQDPQLAAQYHVDKHVVKMVTEYAQLLSTVHRVLCPDDLPDPCYRAFNPKHPSCLWAAASADNYRWLYDLWSATSNEYMHRYGKGHGAFLKLARSLSEPPRTLRSRGLIPVFLAMPEPLKSLSITTFADSVNAYREYYKHHKRHLHTWSHRSTPPWIS